MLDRSRPQARWHGWSIIPPILMVMHGYCSSKVYGVLYLVFPLAEEAKLAPVKPPACRLNNPT